jgi:hypothetical protein
MDSTTTLHTQHGEGYRLESLESRAGFENLFVSRDHSKSQYRTLTSFCFTHNKVLPGSLPPQQPALLK